MPVNFPANPAVNSTYTVSGTVYQWNGQRWQIQSGVTAAGTIDMTNVVSNIIPAHDAVWSLGHSTRRWLDLYLSGNSLYLGNIKIVAGASGLQTISQDGNVVPIAGGNKFNFGTTPPVSPAFGDRWMDAENYKEYVYTTDEDSSQWIQAVTNGGVVGATGPAGPGVDLTSVASHIVPAANVTYDLGSEAYKFRDLYLSGNSIKLGSATISSTGTSVQINDIIAERTYGSNNNGDPIIIIKNAAAANGLTINPNESGKNFHFLPNGNLQLPAGGGIVTDAAYGSNNNGDPIIIIKNAAAANGLTINPNESGKNFHFLPSGNLQLPVGGGIVNSAGDSVLGVSGGVANVYNVAANTTGYFGLPSGTTAERPSTPINGALRFNTSTGYGELYSIAAGQWLQFGASPLVNVEYLVVAGGGGGSGGLSNTHEGGGGGAGGFRTGTLGVSVGTSYTVIVGAGGAGGGGGSYSGSTGSNSTMASITSAGGGYGAGKNTVGGSGGSGGGAWNSGGGAGNTPAVTPSQGNNGGNGNNHSAGGAGGGAGASGGNGVSGPGVGGIGVQSSITGTATYYAGGGGASAGSAGGLGGGGAGGSGTTGSTGTTNTGGGGGGGSSNNSAGGSGGSGIVIIKYPILYYETVSAGLTASTVSIGGYKITTFTSGTGTVTFTIG